MNIRTRLVIAFSAIIALTVTVFALISYNLTSDIAVNQQAELLQRLTYEKAERLATLIHNRVDAENIDWGDLIKSSSGNSYIDVVTGQEGVVASSLNIRDLNSKFSISPDYLLALNRSDNSFGHFVKNKRLYIWARSPIPNTPLNLIDVHFDIGGISSSLSTLTTRLIIWTILLIWVASWVVLIFATVITQRLQKKNEEIEYKSVHDDLTELGNRNLLHSELNRLISSDKLQKKRLALLIADIDRFKELNNTLGHRLGDLILKRVAERLLRTLRGSDVIARFGSDEFGVIAMVDDVEGARSVADKINEALAEPFNIDNQKIKIDVSIGVALYPKHGFDAATIIRHAEVAMYNAKEQSDFVVFYNRINDHHSKRKLELVNQLRSALDNGEMQLHFQPKYSFVSSDFDSVEALLRWYHPTKGILYPAEIIPLAEQTGLIAQITQWALESAMHFCAAQVKLGRTLGVTINLSSHDLDDEMLPNKLSNLLSTHGVDAQAITFDINEAAIITASSHAVAMLHKLSQIGVQIAIDDFGSGYTSLSFLNRLPIDEVKIDSSFIINIDKNDNEKMVRSIIELAHSMSCRVVAKGVETVKTVVRLRKLKCDSLQGYYFCYPMEKSELNGWLGDRNKEMLKLALA